MLGMYASYIHDRELKKFFGCDVEFGAVHDAMVLSRSDCTAAIVDADPYLNNLLVEFCEQALEQRRTSRQHPISTTVENAIAPLLPHGEIRAATIARALGISERTLARRLRAEGQSFSSLLDRLRQTLANRYLAEPGASISEIAWLLGYQEISAFSRAYKRWNGHSPRAARAHVDTLRAAAP
jgi:AraC-like DNA-binding protein